MKRKTIIFALVLALLTSALAQTNQDIPTTQMQPAGRANANVPTTQMQPSGRPGSMGNMGNSNPMYNPGMMLPVQMQITPDGVFLLKTGVLIKYETGSMKQSGLLQLFGAMPAPPTVQDPSLPTAEERDARQAWTMKNMERFAPATMLQEQGKLYILSGDNYFCVDAKTLTLVAKANLALEDEYTNVRTPTRFVLPQLKVEAGVVYALFGQDLLTVEPASGKVLTRTALPPEMFAPPAGLGGLMPGPMMPLNRGSASPQTTH
jgi:hypothetical protein